MEKVVLIIISYLIGSIPFSYLLGKWLKGEDIRKKGSGNLGTTNAFRVFGKVIGMIVLVLDTFKGGIMVLLVKYLPFFHNLDLFHPLIYGLAAVIGHIYPVWFKFKGGKGVASSFGLMLAYDPLLACFILPIFLFVEFLTRYVSVASSIAAISSLLYVTVQHFFFHQDWYFFIVCFVLVSLIIIRHRSNYQRLKANTENRVRLFDFYDRWREKRRSQKNS
jgi:glycerol-3-phosphate acyltransferase PlsY